MIIASFTKSYMKSEVLTEIIKIQDEKEEGTQHLQYSPKIIFT